MQLHNDEKLRANRAPFRASGRKHEGEILHHVLPPSESPGIFERRYILTRGGCTIRLADSPRQHGLARMLINRMYSWRGYHTENDIISEHNPNTLTLEASVGVRLVGTVTLGLDSDEGLLADELYGQQISTFRTEDRKICELSKLAIDPQYSSKEILASLFHLAYIYGRKIHKATDLVIEINPRHTRFYRRMLGLRQIGEELSCPRVHAPAVLMHLELDYVDAQIASSAGLCDSREKSLYPYFFSQAQEQRLAQRLRRHIN